MTNLPPKQIAKNLMEEYRQVLVSGGRPNMEEMLEKSLKGFQEQPKLPPACAEHPRYQGMRKPRGTCEHCHKIKSKEENKLRREAKKKIDS